MRLAVVAPLAESVPPQRYGGTERVVSWLVEELVRRAHDVSLFASADSRTTARLVPFAPSGLRRAGVDDHAPFHLMMLGEVFRAAGQFDLIHSHLDYLAFPFTRLVDVPVVHTLHGRLDLPWLRPIYEHFRDLHLVSVSQAQRNARPRTRFAATVHHGLPRDLLQFEPRGGDYLLFLGRISPEKGPVLAIHAARRARVPLKLAAKIDPSDREYFEREVEPLLDPPHVELVGEIDDGDKQRWLGGARALLLPIQWPEPFGLTFIEALACGTPVITCPRGSVPEIVDVRTTGLVARNLGELVQAIRDVEHLDRADCRRAFEQRFTVERMADEYERVYERVLAGSRRQHSAREAEHVR